MRACACSRVCACARMSACLTAHFFLDYLLYYGEICIFVCVCMCAYTWACVRAPFSIILFYSR